MEQIALQCNNKSLPIGVTFELRQTERFKNIVKMFLFMEQEQLGHDWIQSTENYLSCFPNRIKSEFEVYKPSYI